jgi:glycosyltransferase involved in cell wall biosynthesis
MKRSSQTLIVTAPRGSGGAYALLRNALPRVMRLLPSWNIQVHALSEVLQACFGTTREPWMRPLPGEGYSARLHWEFRQLPALLRADANAIVWAPFGPPFNLMLARRTIWTCHNIIALLPARERELSRGNRTRIRLLRALFWHWARHGLSTVCVSQHARARLARLSRVDTEKIAVIPHGIDPIPSTARCSNDSLEQLRRDPYILHVGEPTPYRRTRELVEAFAVLARTHQQIPRLLMAGEATPADRAYAESCAPVLEPLRRQGHAVTLGTLPHGDVLALMAGARTFAYPSVHEDCPCVVLEALSAGRVGVYAEIPGVRELAADAGVFVSEVTVGALVGALERATFDEALRTAVASAARERAAHFTWDRAAERTATVLQEAATAGRGRQIQNSV